MALFCGSPVDGSSIPNRWPDPNVLGSQSRRNIVRGCAVTLDPAPNYALCKDPGDAVQLTDGKYVEGYFWTQIGTVGWQSVAHAVITIDLGKSEPISGVSFNTASGVSGVYWPSQIIMGVSDDRKTWRYIGELVSLSGKNGSAPPLDYGTYGTHKFVTDALRTRGRYIQFAVFPTGSYAFCDEIEVYRGSDDLRPTGEPVTSLGEYGRLVKMRARIAARLSTDLAIVGKSVDTSALPEVEKARLHTRMEEVSQNISALPKPEASFKAVLPLNALHSETLAINGEVLHSRGLPALLAWRKHRYDPVSPMESPSTPGIIPSIKIAMMRNEYRADAFLLTNATEKAIDARLNVVGMPGGARPTWLSVSAITWTDTSSLLPVAAALTDARYVDGAYCFSVPAGMTRKVWLTADSSMLKAGTFTGSLLVSGGDQPLKLPFELQVSPVSMARPRLSLGTWDYTDGDGCYAVTPGNIESAVRLMRSHFVDTPWARNRALPIPGADDFDSSNSLKAPLDFKSFDAWIRRWSNSRNYYVFLNVDDSFAGAHMGTSAFDARLRAWSRAIVDHMRLLKLEPKQLGLLLLDEPSTDSQDAIIAAWARALKASGSGITLFQDPVWQRPDQAKIQDAITTIDVLCPNLRIYSSGGREVEQYFEGLRKSGHKLWFYMCDGPTRTFDPDRYFRRMSWYAFKHHAVGIGLWAFGDAGGGDTWNEYASEFPSYTPVFFGPDSATDSIYWQAVREGIEDYEYLSMLRQAAERSKNVNLATQARSLIDEAVNALATPFTTEYIWKDRDDRSLADVYRLRVLSLLEKMR